MSNSGYGLLIDYEYCTGCHSCETACKVELDLPTGQYGIKILQDGPRQLESGKWEYNYLPIPTSLCDLCQKRVGTGKLPTCVHHCQAACMTYGPIDELAKKAKDKPKQCLFMPV
jgi:Fe-S-cluster-containing dehydrogenase component